MGQVLNRQRGFIFGPTVLIVGTVVGALVLALVVQTKRLDWAQGRLDTVRAEFREFKAHVEAIGKSAEARAKQREEEDRARQEVANAEAEKQIAALRATVRRLRNERSAGSLVPPAPAGASSPDRATFDRAELDRAVRDFDTEVARLVAEGDEARVKLDAARRWAQGR